ncbi:MAG TPA: hypothetical protein VG228_01375 [Solirubrobacteraceae bacterium]|nr:hypothetical protein [Solirubrobacteraceae bacterium]
MRAIEYGPRTNVLLEHGSIVADQVVLAVNAWAAQIKEIGAGLEDLGRKPRMADRLLAALDPTGYEYRGPAGASH